MQADLKRSEALSNDYARLLKKSRFPVVACPDFLAISVVGKTFAKANIFLGAQDCAPAGRGALTGEVSATDLATLGVNYVILGHSERRTIAGESDELINQKIKTALVNGLVPIVCLGENLEAKEAGQAKSVLVRQLKKALKGVKVKKASEIIIAYEPIWAIGTGQAIIPKEANAIHHFLKASAFKLLKVKPRLVYGGSVTADNSALFLKEPQIDGLLIGGASLNAIELAQICS